MFSSSVPTRWKSRESSMIPTLGGRHALRRLLFCKVSRRNIGALRVPVRTKLKDANTQGRKASFPRKQSQTKGFPTAPSSDPTATRKGGRFHS
jgi:hypothetical protein